VAGFIPRAAYAAFTDCSSVGRIQLQAVAFRIWRPESCEFGTDRQFGIKLLRPALKYLD
jgi:hypothetical protein